MDSSYLANIVRQYITILRDGSSQRAEDALHALMELGVAANDMLIECFRKEDSPHVKRLIVHILWQSRSAEMGAFLLDAFANSEADVWKEALDGLVSLRTENRLGYLTNALECAKAQAAQEKQAFVEEAINDLRRGVL